jgi:hypothetical protein
MKGKDATFLMDARRAQAQLCEDRHNMREAHLYLMYLERLQITLTQ